MEKQDSKYENGMVVIIKDYESLLQANEQLLYRMADDDLKTISSAEVVIYKVLHKMFGKGTNIQWYEVGQWGHNVTHIPEVFIEGIPENENLVIYFREITNRILISSATKEEIINYYLSLRKNGFIFSITEDVFRCIKQNIYHNHSCVKDSLYTLSAYTIYTLMHLEYGGISEPDRITHFLAITERMADTFRRKNTDYGNSFFDSLDEDGLLVAKIHLSEKVNRLSTLLSKKTEPQVKDERIEDTLLDMANYAVMTIMWMDNEQKETIKESEGKSSE